MGSFNKISQSPTRTVWNIDIRLMTIVLLLAGWGLAETIEETDDKTIAVLDEVIIDLADHAF